MPNVQTLEYFPSVIFRDKNGPCPIKEVSASVAATGGTNVQIIAGVAGKLLRVIGCSFISNDATDRAGFFRSFTGGAIIQYINAPANTKPSDIRGFNPAGWFTTLGIGDGLYFETVGTTLINLQYIEFTPSSA